MQTSVEPTRNSALPEGYEHAACFDSGYLKVSAIHQIHYEQYGRRDGKPVIYLHGGPGSRTSSSNATYFDPKIYRVVLFDQRGSGKSLPAAEIRENTSPDLVADIEKLREHLGIEKWHMVFGGSWGSTLALLYAQAHPQKVGCLVLWGVWTMRKSELMWLRGFHGAAYLFPEAFDEFIDFLPPNERSDPYTSYSKRLTSDDPDVHMAAAAAWNKWDIALSELVLKEASFANLSDTTWSLQHARIGIHYEINGAFMEEGQLLKQKNVEKIKHIPCSIVQGRYDIACPPKTAWELKKALPESRLYMIPDAGHSPKEPGTHRKLIEICDEYGLRSFEGV